MPHRTRTPVRRPHRILAQIAYDVPALAPHTRATPALYFTAIGEPVLCRTESARQRAARAAYSRKSPMMYLRSRRTPTPARRHEEARIVSAGKKQPQYAANRRFI